MMIIALNNQRDVEGLRLNIILKKYFYLPTFFEASRTLLNTCNGAIYQK